MIKHLKFAPFTKTHLTIATMSTRLKSIIKMLIEPAFTIAAVASS